MLIKIFVIPQMLPNILKSHARSFSHCARSKQNKVQSIFSLRFVSCQVDNRNTSKSGFTFRRVSNSKYAKIIRHFKFVYQSFPFQPVSLTQQPYSRLRSDPILLTSQLPRVNVKTARFSHTWSPYMKKPDLFP